MQKPKLNSAFFPAVDHIRWPGENTHRIKFSLSLNQKKQQMCSFKSICWLTSGASGVVLQKERSSTKFLRQSLKHFHYKGNFCWSSFVAGPHFQFMEHLSSRMLNATSQSCSRSAPITLSLSKGSFCTKAWTNSSGPI